MNKTDIQKLAIELAKKLDGLDSVTKLNVARGIFMFEGYLIDHINGASEVKEEKSKVARYWHWCDGNCGCRKPKPECRHGFPIPKNSETSDAPVCGQCIKDAIKEGIKVSIQESPVR